MRRRLGKKIDGKSRSTEPFLASTSLRPVAFALVKLVDTLGSKSYTEVQRSQHITQADPRVFGASCGKLLLGGGLAAFLGEETDHRHVEYFQGLEGTTCISVIPLNLVHSLTRSFRFALKRQLFTTARYSAAPTFQHALKPYVDPFPAAWPLGMISPNLEPLSKPCVFQLQVTDR